MKIPPRKNLKSDTEIWLTIMLSNSIREELDNALLDDITKLAQRENNGRS